MKQFFLIFVGLFFTVSAFSQSWSLTGNAGTTNSNFVGTTDNMPLYLKVNNKWAGFTGMQDKFNVSFGYLSFGNSNPLTGGNSNTAIGAQTLQYNSSGMGNVAVGHWALLYNNSSYNIAIGLGAMAGIVQGDDNIAIGKNALYSNLKSQNTVVGNEAGQFNTNGVGLTAMGFKTLNKNTTGEFNTALGYQALMLNTTGYWNVALGSGSLQNNTTGRFNTAGGNSSMHFNQAGVENSAFGEQALGGNINGSYNTAVGCRSLHSVLFTPGTGDSGFGNGSGNTAVGYESLKDITSGSRNVGIGIHSLRMNKAGEQNIAIGGNALYNNTTGNKNIAIGEHALAGNTTGSSNVAVGALALYKTTGSYSVAVGENALYSNTTGTGNTGIGYQALYKNTTGEWNVANGHKALYSNTEGYQNTANGFCALGSNTIGSSNVANGCDALLINTTGSANTAIGTEALCSNNNGYANTAIGRSTLYFNSSGSYNIAIGFWALGDNMTGSYNTAIGTYTGTTINNLDNTTVIGYGAAATASNQVRIGNSKVTSIGGYVPWTTISDGRVKKNIKPDVPGLAFIKKLQPVTYHLDLDAADRMTKADASQENITDSLRALVLPTTADSKKAMQKATVPPAATKAREAQEHRLYSGFVAQDVEKAAKSIGYDFSGVDVDESGNGLYGLRYDEFIMPLVKAVQELSAQNEELSAKNEEKDSVIVLMQRQLDAITGLVSHLLEKESDSGPGTHNVRIPDASLKQNFPNPFNQSTVVSYTLPESFRSALIVVTDISGRIFGQFPLSGRGAGSVTIEAGRLHAGTYNYTLYVDNVLVDTKKMVLTK